MFQKYLIDTSFLAYYIIEEGTENIRLTMQEVMAIRWHMGFSEAKENYNAVGQAMEKYPVVLALHEADLEATKISEIES